MEMRCVVLEVGSKLLNSLVISMNFVLRNCYKYRHARARARAVCHFIPQRAWAMRFDERICIFTFVKKRNCHRTLFVI